MYYIYIYIIYLIYDIYIYVYYFMIVCNQLLQELFHPI